LPCSRVPSSSFLSLAVLFRLTLAGRLTGTERAADLRSTRTTRPPIAGAGRARLAAAALIAGVGLLTVADAPWAHAIGVISLLAFIACGYSAMMTRLQQT
jgi:hypothetical protein